jgi:hypothetical protein
MDAPRRLRSAADQRDEIALTRREYEGEENVVVVDFGPHVEASLDVVGDAAIVVADDRQFEFEVPPEASDVSVNNGLLSITG